jgi:hypothetical protein
MKRRPDPDDDAFVRGYVTATANLVSLHDQPGMARDMLLQLGKVDWRKVDEYDRKVLREAGVFRELHNRRRIERASREGASI